jgi:enoyl-CoA hydratase/carnithine racemase
MSDTRPNDPISIAFRATGWVLLVLGAALGVVAPHPFTTTVWTAAGRAFARGGDIGMVSRLMSATKFGPRLRRQLTRPASRRIGGVCEA